VKFETAYQIANNIVLNLSKFSHKIAIVGELRLKKQEIKRIEILFITKISKYRDLLQFAKNFRWDKVSGKIGITKTIFSHYDGIQVNLIPANEKYWYFMLLRYTGPTSFFRKIKKALRNNNIEISNNALYKNNKEIDIKSENDIFRLAGVEWIPPEKRI